MTVPEVLFVCVHNAGRSQMAAALLDHHAAGRVVVRSAGSAPADTVNPAVVEVMHEIGLDLSKEFPKPLSDDAVRAADVVITMGCGDACPFYPGTRYLDWEPGRPGRPRRRRDPPDPRRRGPPGAGAARRAWWVSGRAATRAARPRRGRRRAPGAAAGPPARWPRGRSPARGRGPPGRWRARRRPAARARRR
nr:hypothetical protein [Angustibacter aerolatus]